MLEAIVWAIGWIVMIIGTVVGTLIAFLIASVLAMLWTMLFLAGALTITGYTFSFMLGDKDRNTICRKGPWNDGIS